MISSICDYQSVVPDLAVTDGATLTARARRPGLSHNLYGDRVNVEITHVTPGPALLYSRIRLTAAGAVPNETRRFGDPPPLSFEVDRQITSKLLPGDLMTICRTACGGIGLSVLRDDRLVMAAGAVLSVPLGRDVEVRVPAEEMSRAEDLLKPLDPEFRWHETPVVVTIRGQTVVLFRGRPKIEGHEIYMVHGHLDGEPGTDECLAIARTDVCQSAAANTTALLIEERRGHPKLRYH